MHPAYGPVPASVAMWNMMRFLATTMKSSPRDFLSVANIKQLSVTELVRKAWSRMSDAERETVVAALRGRGVRLSSPVDFLLSNERTAARFLEVLGNHLDIVEMFPDPDPTKLSVPGSGKLKLVPGFFADESANLIVAARHALQHSGATAVVMGHTHEPEDHPGGMSYVNTGSWTRYLQTNGTNEPTSWALLRRNAVANFPYRLLYAEIAVQSPETVTLKEWRSSKCLV
jgi:hypothetical protein